jgi:hypothetical protein
LQLPDLPGDFHTVRGFAHDLELRLRVEQRAKPGPQDGMIVRDQYSD